MSADKYDLECHLTPYGWVKGTYTYYGKTTEKILPPEGRILTLLKKSVTACGIDPEEVDWEELWREPTATRQISRLRNKFGKYPRF
jgi:hypothetical protein